MRSYIISFNLKLCFILVGLMLFVLCAEKVSAGMSGRDGVIRTPTGAPLAGVTVVEFTDICPSQGVMDSSYPMCPAKTDCYAERTTKTDTNGYYFFPPGVPADGAAGPYCDFLDWRRFTCSNPRVFYKVRIDSVAQANTFVKTAFADEGICPPPVPHNVDNVEQTLTHNFTCPPPPACNTVCQNQSQCAFAADGCTACVEGLCKPPPVCNTPCERDDQCAGALNGCTSCLPSDSGTGKVCRPAAACNVACTRDDQCAGARDGCNSCMGGVCKKPPACNESCSTSAECVKSGSSCTECLPGDNGGTVCRPPAACNVACTRDDQCAGAKDGCTVCRGGACKPPPACGTACSTRADCANPKDGCSECLEGTCTDYTDNMCKCDGLTAELNYPNPFKFEAFGKVDGKDAKKAEIADITFRLTKDNAVIAKSNPITPTIVQNDSTKVRFKANWETPAPQVDRNSTYRVFADVRCKPKKIIADASTFTPNEQLAFVKQAEIKTPSTETFEPKGLAWIVKTLSEKFNNGKVNPFVGEVLAQLSSPLPSPSSAGSNLQLSTLNFVKLMDTDNCRFVMFKFDETLF